MPQHRPTPSPRQAPSWRRRLYALRYALKLRLVLVFVFLALALGMVFVGGAQRAFRVGWREAARPLVMDYVDRLMLEITVDGSPSVARAQALTQRLPLVIEISGPRIHWRSHPDMPLHHRHGTLALQTSEAQWGIEAREGAPNAHTLRWRTTADGHRVEFGLDQEVFEHKPLLVLSTLAALLVLTLLAFLYVRHLLRPLDAIRAGAIRFGAGVFDQPIAKSATFASDELSQLADTINTMGRDIHQMLEAKRALLLAMSHELRSPLTRARLNAELLPETAEVNPQRTALMRDLMEMGHLINDLLESERLASRHAALQCAPLDLRALAQEVLAALHTTYANAASVQLEVAPALPVLALDAARMRLLLRNLLDNALRHSPATALPVQLHLRHSATQNGIEIEVRDYGPGVPEDQLTHLAEPFFRPDTARSRSSGGVGLGLTLCKLVAQAHGGTLRVRNAQPGLAVTVFLPQPQSAA